MKQILFSNITVNDGTTMAMAINSDESAVNCNGDNKYKCANFATDESSSDSNIQSSYTTLGTTNKNSNTNCASADMR